MIFPPGPVPAIAAGSRLFSPTSRRTDGRRSSAFADDPSALAAAPDVVVGASDDSLGVGTPGFGLADPVWFDVGGAVVVRPAAALAAGAAAAPVPPVADFPPV